ncbi:hypothetical protein [Paraburkholderia kirstenboschensis]|uniref:hypothetical protein n=1 Tax=Paraburkholderia kirstenboschensis TaxID=1245436 RepID=UPI000FFCA5C4|nr:hypothetical protein [Paraburkholderia kirstenboschensis]
MQLVLGTSGLPRLAAPRYPLPTHLANGWKPLAGEFFHPNVTGLTLDPVESRYTYRHAPPILADGYLRAMLDGTLGSTLASQSLAAVRPVDDLAIDAIAVKIESSTVYQVRGWLAAPQTVTVSKLELALGGATRICPCRPPAARTTASNCRCASAAAMMGSAGRSRW